MAAIRKAAQGGHQFIRFSGTNAHIVVEEAPAAAKGAEVAERPLHILPVSAKTERALSLLVHRYVSPDAEPGADASFEDVAFTAAAGRAHFEYRTAVVASDWEQARGKLAKAEVSAASRAGAPRVAFLFSGQGSQYPGMGKALYRTQPVFRKAMDECGAILEGILEPPLLAAMESEQIHQTAYTQPGLFALEYAVACLWRSWGVEPVALLGHSVGEYVAAVVAGVCTLEEGLRLIARRGALMQALPAGGKMAAVFTGEAVVRRALSGRSGQVAIAAVNGPANVVISGAGRAVEEALDRLDAEGILAQELTVSHAFHSPLMEPMLDEFDAAASAVRFQRPRITLISNLTGRAVREEMDSPRYWRRHVREAVRFSDGIAALLREGCDALIETGPQPVLIGMGRKCAEGAETLWLPSLRKGRGDWEQMLESLAALYLRGAEIDWAGFDKPYQRRKVTAPLYPFERERYWSDAAEMLRQPGSRMSAASGENTRHPLLGRRLCSALPEAQFEANVGRGDTRYLFDDRVFGHAIFPAAGYIEAGLAAAAAALGDERREIGNLVIREPLELAPGGTNVQVILRAENEGAAFEFYSMDAPSSGSASWRLHATGEVSPAAVTGSAASLEQLRSLCAEEVATEAFYAGLRLHGLDYGPSFRVLSEVRRGENRALARVRLPEELSSGAERYQIHPALLDGALQLLGACVSAEETSAWMPIAAAGVRVDLRAETELWAHAAVGRRGLSSTLIGNVDLFSADGRPAGAITGITLKPADREMLERASKIRVEDWLYEVQWQEKERDGSKAETLPETHGAWIVLEDECGVGRELAERLRADGETCRVIAGDQVPDGSDAVAEILRETGRCPAVVDLRKQSSCRALLHLCQAMARVEVPATPRMWVLTRGAQAVDGRETGVDAAQATLWGLAKSVGLEHPELRPVVVDLAELDGVAEKLYEELRSPDGESEIAWRGGVRFVPRLVRSPNAAAVTGLKGVPGRLLSEPERTCVITGGTGALGLLTAEWLAGKGVKNMILISRSRPGAGAEAGIGKLREAGVRVVAGQADVSRKDELRRVLDEALAEGLPAIGGVIHAAAVLDDGVLLQQSWDRFEKVLAAKAEGAWNLHELTRDLKLEFFVLYSSAVSVLGSPGQSNYTAANAYLDALARHRRAQGLAALSINWAAWSEVGLAARRGADARLALHGIGAIPPARGLEILERAFGFDTAGLAAMPIQWPKLLAQFPGGGYPRLLEEMAAEWRGGSGGGRRAAADSELLRRWNAAPEGEREAALIAYLREQAAKVLGLAASRRIERDRPLRELGLDSLMAVELRNMLGKGAGVTLPTSLLFEYPTIDALAGYLSREVLEGMAGPVRRAAPAMLASEEPIAVIGMGCRFPGAAGLAGYWDVLRNGVDAITEIPPERWDTDAYYDADPDAAGKMYTRWGGFCGMWTALMPVFSGFRRARRCTWTRSSGCCWKFMGGAGACRTARQRLVGEPVGGISRHQRNDYVNWQTKAT